MLNNRLTALRLPAALAAAAVMLGGCGFLPGSNSEAASSPTAEETTSLSLVPVPSGTTAAKNPVLRGSYDPEDHSDLRTREEYEPLVSKVISCSDGYATIDAAGTAFQIDANCAYVAVTGAANAVVAEDISTLEINGANLTIFARNIDKISATGAGNRVFWTGATPTIIDTGVNNKFLPAP